MVASCAVEGKLTNVLSFHNDCSSNQFQIIFKYFDDQHFLSVIDLTSEHILNSLMCIKSETKPLSVFTSLSSVPFGFKIEANSISSYATSRGYFIKCLKDEISKQFYEEFKNNNPKSKIMIKLTDGSFKDAKKLLETAYDKYKLLSVAVLLEFENMVGVKSSLCLYNPFSGNEFIRSPNFHCINFTTSELSRQLQEISEFTNSRVSNLERFPLKIDIFSYPMVCKPVYDVKNESVLRYTYADGDLVNIMSQQMNFTPIFVASKNSTTYGFVDANGTFSGSLAALENEIVDYVANPRLISSYQTKKALFLQPITTSQYKFIIKKTEKKRQLMISLLTQYDKWTQIIALSLIVIFPIVFFLIKTVESKILRKKNPQSLVKSVLYVFAIHHNISVVHSKFASSRVIIITMIFYALIVTSVFQGTIVKNLNLHQHDGAIKSIEELLDLDYKMLLTHALKGIFVKQSGDRLREKLNRIARTRASVGTDEGLGMLQKEKNVAFLWGNMYTGSYLNRYYDDVTGENLYEVVPETAFEFYIGSMAPKASPLIEKFNEVILRFIESGLNIHHIKLAFFDNDSIWYQRQKENLTPKGKSQTLNLKDLEMVFKTWAILILVSIITLSVEISIYFVKKLYN